MALYKCKECSKKVSETAQFCPNCGATRKILEQGFNEQSTAQGIIGCFSLIAICCAMSAPLLKVIFKLWANLGSG